MHALEVPNLNPLGRSNDYFVICDLPGGIGPGNAGPEGVANAMPAGAKDVSAVFVGSQGGMGATQLDLSQAYYTADSRPYLLAVAPQVDALSPHTGSLTGSTLLTITGQGFPDPLLDPQALSMLDVRIGGRTCAPQSTSYTQVVCLTPSLADAAQDVAMDGYHPGGQGVLVEIYPGVRA